MSVIRLQNTSKGYESGPVLRDVCFRLATGDRKGLVGKNGAEIGASASQDQIGGVK